MKAIHYKQRELELRSLKAEHNNVIDNTTNDQIMSYQLLANKYRRASDIPWLPVPPDPPAILSEAKGDIPKAPR